MKNSSEPRLHIDRIHKDLVYFFKDNGLDVTISTNLFRVDFFNVTLDLDSDKFISHREPNDTPLYIHKE